MIVGIGTDIADIRRIERLFLKFQDKFTKKIFTAQEISFCSKRNNFVQSVAKMFAIKESVLKAISDVSGIGWHDIEVIHDANGRPGVILSGTALKNLQKKSREYSINVSVSDEKDYAIAFVVIEDNATL